MLQWLCALQVLKYLCYSVNQLMTAGPEINMLTFRLKMTAKLPSYQDQQS
jgi:hypothetical protein